MELRVQNFQKDATKLLGSADDRAASSKLYTFSEFDLQPNNVFVFKWTSKPTGNVCRVSFLASEDYPDNSVITQHWELTGAEHSIVCCITVNNLLQKIGEELLVAERSENSMDTKTSTVARHPENYGEASECSDSEFSDCQSHISDDMEDFDQSDYYCDMDSFAGISEGYGKSGMNKIHPLLQSDMQTLKDKFGESCLSYRLLDSIGEIDVELKIPLNFLNLTTQMARAWKLNIEEPLIVRIHLASVSYLDSPDCPKVEVFQASKKNVCGISPQMKNILDGFLRKQWRHLNNSHLCTALSHSHSVPADLSGLSERAGKMEMCALGAASGFVSEPEQVDDRSLAQLVEMGFQAQLARNALIITRGNLQEATLLLSSDLSSCADEDMDAAFFVDGHHSAPNTRDGKTSANTSAATTPKQHSNTNNNEAPAIPPRTPQPADSVQSTSKKKSSPFHKSPPQKATTAPVQALTRQLSHPPKLPPRKKIDYSRSKSMTSSQTEPSLMLVGGIQQDRHMKLEVEAPLSNVKEVPSLKDGFLVMMLQYARQRIPTLNEFCVVCDEPHVFQNGAMLMPAVCSRELCVFAYQTLGVMVDAAADIATGAEVVDLLIAMTRAAIVSQRRIVIFDPFPNIVDPNNPKELAFSEKNKDYRKLESLVNHLPSMKMMTSISCGQLHAQLDTTDKLLFPLLTWIISSNRSHIVKLPPERQIKFMVTPHQFLLLNSPPAKEAAFQAAKERYGSTFAFHGSSIENWHSIIRIGLIVASGTKRQVNGAAYGLGIYLSPLASMSFNYSCMGYSHHHVGKNAKVKDKLERTRFLSSRNLNCIALCEVIRSPQLKMHQDIWVCPEPDHVCTRFFFVYEDGQVGDNSIDMNKEHYRQIVQQAMSYIVKS